MFLKNIKIKNFRNYESLNLNFLNGINIIYGNNAQGKTNLLESIYFLSFSKSHRSFIDNTLIKEKEQNAYISGVIEKNDSDYKLEIGFNNKDKKMKIDQVEIKKVSDYISLSNIIIFYPEDLNLIKGSPKDRRRFLNLEIGQIYPNYLDVVNDYSRLLKMRNEYLKKIKENMPVDRNYFDILTSYLIDRAADIYILRNKFVKRLNEFTGDIYKDILDLSDFHIKYVTGLNNIISLEQIKDELKAKFDSEKENEFRQAKTLFGPHLDDIEFYLGNKNLKFYGSQGQQRVAILALKLSELEVFTKYKDITPILLLDDVFSELDDIKKNNLLKYIDRDLQVFITTTELNSISPSLLERANKIKIENAQVINVEEVD